LHFVWWLPSLLVSCGFSLKIKRLIRWGWGQGYAQGQGRG
jgi:hypothetical protein